MGPRAAGRGPIPRSEIDSRRIPSMRPSYCPRMRPQDSAAWNARCERAKKLTRSCRPTKPTPAGRAVADYVGAWEELTGKHVVFVAPSAGQAAAFAEAVDPSQPDTIFLYARGDRALVALAEHEWAHTLAQRTRPFSGNGREAPPPHFGVAAAHRPAGPRRLRGRGATHFSAHSCKHHRWLHGDDCTLAGLLFWRQVERGPP